MEEIIICVFLIAFLVCLIKGEFGYILIAAVILLCASAIQETMKTKK